MAGSGTLNALRDLRELRELRDSRQLRDEYKLIRAPNCVTGVAEIERGRRYRKRKLYDASRSGSVDSLNELIKEVEILAQDSVTCVGATPLHIAAMLGHTDFVIQPVRHLLCVKHNHLEALKLLVELGKVDVLINAKDDDGFPILHLATSLKQMKTKKYLLNRSEVKANAVNGKGFTALDIIEHMPRDTKVVEIRESLLNAGVSRAPPSDVPPMVEKAGQPSQGDRSIKKHVELWFEMEPHSVMLAATLIAVTTYAVGLNPPGGVWQEDGPIGKNGKAKYLTGESTMAYHHPDEYPLFWLSNTVSFVASVSIVLLIVSGIPMERRKFMWILKAAMWVSITFMAFTYLFAMYALAPSQYLSNNTVNNDISRSQYLPHTILDVIYVSVPVWMGLIVIIFLVRTVPLLIWCIRKVIKLVKMYFSCYSTPT